MRSRGTAGGRRLVRDLIEAGLSEPAGWHARYGDCVGVGSTETSGVAGVVAGLAG